MCQQCSAGWDKKVPSLRETDSVGLHWFVKTLRWLVAHKEESAAQLMLDGAWCDDERVYWVKEEI